MLKRSSVLTRCSHGTENSRTSTVAEFIVFHFKHRTSVNEMNELNKIMKLITTHFPHFLSCGKRSEHSHAIARVTPGGLVVVSGVEMTPAWPSGQRAGTFHP
jgi:hypothetical protein